MLGEEWGKKYYANCNNYIFCYINIKNEKTIQWEDHSKMGAPNNTFQQENSQIHF